MPQTKFIELSIVATGAGPQRNIIPAGKEITVAYDILKATAFRVDPNNPKRTQIYIDKELHNYFVVDTPYMLLWAAVI